MTAPRLEAIDVDDLRDRESDIIRFLSRHMEGRDPAPAAEESWRWYLLSSPWGRGLVSLVVDADAGGAIVGHSAIAFLPCSFGGRKSLAGRVGPVFLRPEYRGMGAYARLRKIEDESARSRGLPVLFCTPNQVLSPALLRSSFRSHQRLGIVQAPVRLLRRGGWKRPTGSLKHAALYLLRPRARPGIDTRGLEIRKLETFGAETETLWGSLRETHVGISKDAAYLDWRYRQRPNTSFQAFLGSKAGEPKALCIVEWRKDQPREGWVAELLAGEGEEPTAAALLLLAERSAAEAGVEQLIALADGVSLMGSVITEFGYYPLRPRRFMIEVFEGNPTPEVHRAWNFSTGDYLTMRRLV